MNAGCCLRVERGPGLSDEAEMVQAAMQNSIQCTQFPKETRRPPTSLTLPEAPCK